MHIVSTSRRRGTVKIRKPRLPEPTADQLAQLAAQRQNADTFGLRLAQEQIALESSWADRHPILLVSLAIGAAIGILSGLIYLLPKGTPERYAVEERGEQPKLSALTRETLNVDKRPGATDSSFLSTPYRKDIPSAGGAPSAMAASSPASASSGSENGTDTRVASVSYGDGTVKRVGNNCQVNASGSRNFETALVDCVSAGK